MHALGKRHLCNRRASRYRDWNRFKTSTRRKNRAWCRKYRRSSRGTQLQPVYTTYGTKCLERYRGQHAALHTSSRECRRGRSDREEKKPEERRSPHNATNPTKSIELSVTVAWRVGCGRANSSFSPSLSLLFLSLWTVCAFPLFFSSPVFPGTLPRVYVQRVHTDVDFLWRVG